MSRGPQCNPELFDRGYEIYQQIVARYDGEHNPLDRMCIVIKGRPNDLARCRICREADFLIVDPDYPDLAVN